MVRKTKTANAFSDGKTSFDYRRERFASVPTHFSLPQDDQLISQLLALYEANHMASLELKCGALELLSTLKEMGKKIVVITEGPQDAQERALRGLGIDEFIDFLGHYRPFSATQKLMACFLKFWSICALLQARWYTLVIMRSEI